MATFKVTLERRIHRAGESENPFTPVHISPGSKSDFNLRSWEFEAKDEAEVRAYLDDAYKQRIPAVMGYNLRSIERVDAVLAIGRES